MAANIKYPWQKGDRCCSECKFWEREYMDDPNGVMGACHARPPVIVAGLLSPVVLEKEVRLEGIFPTTQDSDWCGEWEPDKEFKESDKDAHD